MDKFVTRKSGEKYKHNTDENTTTLPMVPSTSNLEQNTYKKEEKSIYWSKV